MSGRILSQLGECQGRGSPRIREMEPPAQVMAQAAGWHKKEAVLPVEVGCFLFSGSCRDGAV